MKNLVISLIFTLFIFSLIPSSFAISDEKCYKVTHDDNKTIWDEIDAHDLIHIVRDDPEFIKIIENNGIGLSEICQIFNDKINDEPITINSTEFIFHMTNRTGIKNMVSVTIQSDETITDITVSEWPDINTLEYYINSDAFGLTIIGIIGIVGIVSIIVIIRRYKKASK